jgi:hypothetical protein
MYLAHTLCVISTYLVCKTLPGIYQGIPGIYQVNFFVIWRGLGRGEVISIHQQQYIINNLILIVNSTQNFCGISDLSMLSKKVPGFQPFLIF